MNGVILFSNESRFSIHPDNRRIFIWWGRGTQNNPASRVRFGGGGVMVYAGISIDGRTDLYFTGNEALTGRQYRE